MQRIKDLMKSAFALRATVICMAAMLVSIAVVALALNLTVYEIKKDVGMISIVFIIAFVFSFIFIIYIMGKRIKDGKVSP